MSDVATSLPIKPYVWRHKDEADIIKEYLASVQRQRDQGEHSDDEDELSDRDSDDSDTSSDVSESESCSSEGEFHNCEEPPESGADEGDDNDWVDAKSLPSGPNRNFLRCMHDFAPYEPNDPTPVYDEDDLRATQRAWDDALLGRAPFDNRRTLVQWHERLIAAINDMDDEYAAQHGFPSSAIKRRETVPVVDLRLDREVSEVAAELRARSTVEVAHAPMDNLRRGLLYLAQTLYLKESLMKREHMFPPKLDSDNGDGTIDDSDDAEYVFV
ncbi:hypothetical protein FOMPIDRAFT_1063509 [Fomitopsis schrenkii]|uniref:Uncharacterized protein n=1 Tax=Fomitopsis schrenkii TaxID=2126942 RepID=S8DIR5_FOMSC|nr:hypothetical protein FOMPIDRAFT_1063509 [Fomitopsis schrenkii]